MGYVSDTQYNKENYTGAEEFDVNADGCIDLLDYNSFANDYPVIQSYNYDAFGNQLDENKPNDTNPFRYCGEYWDEETGEIYLRARYYNSKTGRFGTRDKHWNVDNMIYGDDSEEKERHCIDVNAIKQSCNLYIYCMGNPTNYIDIYGEKVYAVGISAAAELGISVGGGAFLVFDDEGNIGVWGNISGGAGYFGAGITLTKGEFFYNSTDELSNETLTINVSGGEVAIAGASLVLSSNGELAGVLLGSGVGLGSPIDANVHPYSISGVFTPIKLPKSIITVLKIAYDFPLDIIINFPIDESEEEDK